MLAPVLVTPPAVLPVSLAEVKDHLRIEHSDHDERITRLLEAATSYLDGWSGILGRALITQTWREDRHRFPAEPWLPLRLAPAQSMTSIAYSDDDDVEQVLDAAVWSGPFPGPLRPYVALKRGESWPATFDREDAVRVTYVAGYGDVGADVPAAVRAAILLLTGHWYENSEAVVVGTIATKLPMAVEALLAPFRRTGM